METVQSTTHYDLFKVLPGNRKVNSQHVESLRKSIDLNGFISQNPIIVNENHYVIDGQHRLEAARKLGEPVYYVMLKGGDLESVQLLNATQRPWLIDDYLESYIELGNKEYVYLKEFCEKWEIPVSTGVLLLTGRLNSERYLSEFHKGTFRVTHAEQADFIADILLSLNSFADFRANRNKTMLNAVMSIFRTEGGQQMLRDLVEKYRVTGERVIRRSSVKDQLRDFEDVLNWKRKDGKSIRLY